MNLIILTEKDRIDENRFVVKDHRFEHIRDILKLKIDDTVEIGILNGVTGSAIIEEISREKITLKIISTSSVEPCYPIVDVICALPRPQTLKKILFTSAMMNVRQLHLIRANRVEKSYFHSPLLEEKNYRRFLFEGLAQGKNTKMPEVRIHYKFKQFCQDFLPELEKEYHADNLLKLLPDLGSNHNLTRYKSNKIQNIIIAIGPEGGWVPFEIELFSEIGFHRFALGKWTLRVEHALTAALSQIALNWT